MKLRFRPNVAAILQRQDGRILIGERSDIAGAWQFPQGGIDKGEKPLQALRREVWEEIAVPASAYEVVDEKGPYRYVLGGGRTKKGFHGQEQQYFLLRLKPDQPSEINVRTAHQEFRQTRWIRPEEFCLDWVAAMKREVYRAVFKDFFGVSL